MNSNKIGKSVCGLLVCTLMISGCSVERKTGHETTANDQDKTIVQKSKDTDLSKTVGKDTADEQTAANKQEKTKVKQEASKSTVKTQNKEENKTTAKNDTNTNTKKQGK